MYEDDEDSENQLVKDMIFADETALRRSNFQVKMKHGATDYGKDVLYCNMETKYKWHHGGGAEEHLLTLMFSETESNLAFIIGLSDSTKVEGLPTVTVRQFSQADPDVPVVEYVYRLRRLVYQRKSLHYYSKQMQTSRFMWIADREVNTP